MSRTFRHIERLVLHVPIEQAYEFVANPANDVQWYSGVHASRRIADDVYEQSLSMLGIKYHSRVRVMDENPPNSTVLVSVDSKIPFRAEYRFTALTPESTEFVMDASVSVSGPFRVLGPLFPVVLRRRVGRNFAQLGAMFPKKQPKI